MCLQSIHSVERKHKANYDLTKDEPTWKQMPDICG